MKGASLRFFWLLVAIMVLPGWPIRSTAQLTNIAPVAESRGGNSDRPSARIQRNQVVVAGKDVLLKADESSREVVCLVGNAVIQGNVERDVFVLGGRATIEGSLGRDLNVLFGSATLAPTARIKGRAVVLGGELRADPAAVIGRERVEISLGDKLPGLSLLKEWLKSGLLLARPLPPRLGWVWIVVAVCFLINVVLAVMFPGTLRAGVETLEKRPVGSFFMGLVIFILFGPLMLMLMVSGVGILVVPFLLCALAAAALFGKVIAYRFAGLQFGRHFGLPAVQLPLAALAVGTVIFYVLYMVPVLGFVVWGGVTLLGVGTVALAATAKLGREYQPLSAGSGSSTGAAAIAPVEAVSPEVARAEMASLPRVGFWRRLVAMALDLVLIVLLTAVIHVPPLGLILWLVYHVGMWSWKGTTVGGVVMGIKTICEDGRPMSFAVALVRSLSSVFSFIILGLGFFWAGWSRSRQAWHDKIAGTIVVKVPRNIPLI